MHGITKPITLHVKLLSPISRDTKETRWAVTTEPLKRGDFKLMFSQGTEAISGISQTVAVNIEIEASRVQ
jgi:polyisoprenoid-binding protein YceI